MVAQQWWWNSRRCALVSSCKMDNFPMFLWSNRESWSSTCQKNGTNLWEVKSWKPIQKILRVSWQLAIPFAIPFYTITLTNHSDDVTSWWSMGWFFYWTHVKKYNEMVNKKQQHWCDGWLPLITLITWSIDIFSGSQEIPLAAYQRYHLYLQQAAHQSPVTSWLLGCKHCCKPFKDDLSLDTTDAKKVSYDSWLLATWYINITCFCLTNGFKDVLIVRVGWFPHVVTVVILRMSPIWWLNPMCPRYLKHSLTQCFNGHFRNRLIGGTYHI